MILSIGIRRSRIKPQDRAAFRAAERPLSRSALGTERQTAARTAEINVALAIAKAVEKEAYFRKQGRKEGQKGAIFLGACGVVFGEDSECRVKRGQKRGECEEAAAGKQNHRQQNSRKNDQNCGKSIGAVSTGKKITPILQSNHLQKHAFLSKTNFSVKSIAQKPIFVKPCF